MKPYKILVPFAPSKIFANLFRQEKDQDESKAIYFAKKVAKGFPFKVNETLLFYLQSFS